MRKVSWIVAVLAMAAVQTVGAAAWPTRETYSVLQDQKLRIIEWDICKDVTNHANAVLMVPTKTAVEWANYVSNKPFSTVEECPPPAKTSVYRRESVEMCFGSAFRVHYEQEVRVLLNGQTVDRSGWTTTGYSECAIIYLSRRALGPHELPVKTWSDCAAFGQQSYVERMYRLYTLTGPATAFEITGTGGCAER